MPVIALSQSNDDEELNDQSSPAHVLEGGFGRFLALDSSHRPGEAKSAEVRDIYIYISIYIYIYIHIHTYTYILYCILIQHIPVYG